MSFSPNSNLMLNLDSQLSRHVMNEVTSGGLGRLVGKPEAIHVSEKSPYPANVCPLSCGFEFASFGEDFGQAVGEPIEAASRGAVRERAAEHLD